MRFNDVLSGLGSTAAHRGHRISLETIKTVAVTRAATVAIVTDEGIQFSEVSETRNVGNGGAAIAPDCSRCLIRKTAHSDPNSNPQGDEECEGCESSVPPEVLMQGITIRA